jgi:hypothetical protein
MKRLIVTTSVITLVLWPIALLAQLGGQPVQGGVPKRYPGLTVNSYPSCRAVQPQMATGGSAYVQ